MCRECRKNRRETIGLPVPSERLCATCGTPTTCKKRDFTKRPATCLKCFNETQQTTPEQKRERAANNCAIRRARKLGTVVEKFDRKEIFERDNYVCHICDEPTDATVRHPSPLAPTIDHVIPLAKGGTHTRDNIKTAHSRCNIAKGIKVLSLRN